MDSLCVQQVAASQLLTLPRLLNNRMMELRQQFLSRPRRDSQRGQVITSRQNLFGSRPSEKKDNLDFAEGELKKMTQADSQKWNFDIESGQPMEEGQYHWKLINETNQALDTSGRLTCITRPSVTPSAEKAGPSSKPLNDKCNNTSPTLNGFPSSSKNPMVLTPSPTNTNKRAVTTTTFSTSTTPTAVISKKCAVKRLQKSAHNGKKVPKLITDYFKESKQTAANKCKGKNDMEVTDENDTVSNRLVEILKIRSMNVR